MTRARIDSTHGGGALGCRHADHGWEHWAAEWLGWVTETLSKGRALLVEVADVADVQVRKSDIRVDNDVDDDTTAPDFTKLSRSWCEYDTLALESVYFTIILRVFPVVVREIMFGLVHRVLILSLRTALHATLTLLAATAPSRLDSREGYRQ